MYVHCMYTVGSLFKPLGAYEKHEFWLKLYKPPTPAFTVLFALPWFTLTLTLTLFLLV